MNCRPIYRSVMFGVCFLAGSVAASAEDLSKNVNEMLDQAWKLSPSGLKRAALQYQEMIDKHPTDNRIKFGYSLLLIRNHKYDDSLKLLSEVLNARNDCLPARQARLWVRILKKDYEAALMDLEALVVAVPADCNTPQEQHWIEFCHFLGSSAGFLAGPAAVPEVRLMGLRAKVKTALVDQHLTAYSAAESDVKRKFDNFNDSIQKVQAADHERAVAQKEELRNNVFQDKQVVRADRANWKNEVNQMAASEVRDYAAWSDQVTTTQQTLMASQRWMNFLAGISGTGGGYCDSDHRRRDDDPGHSHSSGSRHYHAPINTDSAMMGSQNIIDGARMRLNQLQYMYGVASNYYASYRQRLNQWEKPILKEERRIALLERSLAQPIPMTSVRSRALTQISKSATSYSNLPYEKLRVQLVASLQGSK